MRASTRSVVARALERAPGAQPWPGQFKRRALEFELLERAVDLGHPNRVLEIGCGNAFGSALLADRAQLVVATDLPARDVQTHSIGMDAPRRLLRALELRNCYLAACSAENLPFADGAFDLVFSLYVLEHVPDRPGALAEIHRVLSPGGRIVAFVPNAVERVYAPLLFYLYLANRALARLPLRSKARGGDGNAGEQDRQRRPFREAYPHFPLPEPHGAYPDSFAELRSHLPGRWASLFAEAGFAIERRFYLMTVPVNLAGAVLGDRATPAYGFVANVDRRLGVSRLGKFLGQYTCIVARRAD